LSISNMPLTEPPIWLTTAMMAMATVFDGRGARAVGGEAPGGNRKAHPRRVGSVEGVWPMVLPQTHNRSRNAILSGSSAGGMS
jgi:hypothetical protein